MALCFSAASRRLVGVRASVERGRTSQHAGSWGSRVSRSRFQPNDLDLREDGGATHMVIINMAVMNISMNNPLATLTPGAN